MQELEAMPSATGIIINGDSDGNKCFSSFFPLSLTFFYSLARRRGLLEVLSAWAPRRCLKNIDPTPTFLGLKGLVVVVVVGLYP
jgi:hypothetical protein